MGTNAGSTGQNDNSIAIGQNAGSQSQGTGSIAIGNNAGSQSQGQNAIAIGTNAGSTGQNNFGIAMGQNAGSLSQGTGSIAIGTNAGSTGQGQNAIAIGTNAGFTGQNDQSIALGYFSTQDITHGTGSVAIGSFQLNTSKINIPSNSILLNASTADVDFTAFGFSSTGGFYVTPIRPINLFDPVMGALKYNTNTFEIISDLSKTFVINHPVDPEKYLVHACLEGPESGVYYRGKSKLLALETETQVILPLYVKHLATDFTCHITSIGKRPRLLSASEVLCIDNSILFYVYGQENINDVQEFHWVVYGKRNNIEVEVDKVSAKLHGNGPYTWLSQ